MKKESLIAVLVAAGLAVALTWPIAPRFFSAGRVDSGDGRFSVWNVAWVARALTSHPAQLYRANIFYPRDNALVYSESNLFAGLISAPVWWATRNAYATSNFSILASFVLAALAMYALVRHLTGSIVGAAAAAVNYAFCPYVFSHIPHIQLLMTFGPPLALLCLHRLIERPSLARGGQLGLALAAQALACGYYGIFGGLVIGFGVIWLGCASGRWREARYWTAVLFAAGAAGALVLPFLGPYFQIRVEGFGRTLADARLFSADWRAYLASPLLFHQWMLPLLENWREVLFPGFVPIGLALIGLFYVSTRRRALPPRMPPHVIGFYLVLAGLAMWASFGPDAKLYTWLYQTVPMMSFLRAPARFGLLVTLSVTLLGGLGAAMLAERWRGRRRTVLLTAAGLLLIARSTPGLLPLVEAPQVNAVYRRLALLPPGPVIEFPFFSAAPDRSRHTEYMLASTIHWQPLINGYSDHIPARTFADMTTLSRFPADEAWSVLHQRGARYIVVHWNLYPASAAAPLSEQLNRADRGLRLLLDGGAASLFEVAGWREHSDTTAVTSSGNDGG